MLSFQQFVEDLQTLTDKTISGFPDTLKRHNAVSELSEPKLVVNLNPDKATALFKAQVPGSKGDNYESKILFHRVSYKPIPLSGQLTFADYVVSDPKTGRKYILDKLGMKDMDVKVSCTCPDFQHRFSKYNADHGALIGKPEDNYGRNPNEVPGMCKHLFKTVEYLKEKGILTNSPRAGW